MRLIVSTQPLQATIIDPANLAQNILQVIQQKITSKINGDSKEIADNQLKTETQTTADIIGLNSTTKTNLNLGMATFNYENTPSPIYKSYYKDLKIRDKNYSIFLYSNSVKKYYVDYVLVLCSPLEKDGYVAKFNAISQAVSDNDAMYAKFTNTVDNPDSPSTNVDATNGNYNSSGTLNSQIKDDPNTKAIVKEFNTKMSDLQDQLADFQRMKNEIKDDWKDAPAEVIRQLLIPVNAKIFDIQDQITETSSSLQSSLSSALSGALGGIGNVLGFGGSANEKGKGQEVKIVAKMGQMTDAERVNFANKAYKDLNDIEASIYALDVELRTMKGNADMRKFRADNTFSASGFYDKSGSMDSQKMMNFDQK